MVLVWAQWLWTETLRILVPFPPFYCLHMVSSSCHLLFLSFPPSELLMLASIYVPKTESSLHQSIFGFLYCFPFSTPGGGGGVQQNKTNTQTQLLVHDGATSPTRRVCDPRPGRFFVGTESSDPFSVMFCHVSTVVSEGAPVRREMKPRPWGS